MKIVKPIAALLFLCMTTGVLSAQRIKLLEGNLSPLKSEKTIYTEFTFDNMKVGKYDKEADYVRDKTAEYNKKEAGKGDKWAQSWVDDRTDRFKPKFNDLFTKEIGMSIDNHAKYTLIYKTTFTEPGYNIAISRKNASTNAEVWIVETHNKDKVIAKLSVTRAEGRMAFGMDFDTGARLAEAYAIAGREVAEFIKKNW